MTALMRMKAAFTNFDTVVRPGDGVWDPGLPMCGWQGVTCWPDGAVQSVQLSIPARAPAPAISPLAAPGAGNSSVHASVPQRLAGGRPLFLLQPSLSIFLLLCVGYLQNVHVHASIKHPGAHRVMA